MRLGLLQHGLQGVERRGQRAPDNVRITRTTGDKILTNQMYYETTQALTHSDSFIRIEGQGRVIEGEGYEYYDKQRHYKINHVQGIFPIDDRKFMPRR